MKLAIIGTGYVGLPTGVGFAELGINVVCIDNNKSKIETLSAGKTTLFEEGLDELLAKNINTGCLAFTDDMAFGVRDADVVMLAVGTPPDPKTGQADMQYIHAAANQLAPYLGKYTVIANKSTVPIGTGDIVESIIKAANPDAEFDVVSLPEFLREGFAVYDFFNPDRIILGSESPRATGVIRELYKPFLDKTPMLVVGRRSSETIKYASNAFLAMKIHYINEMADFCEAADANVFEVAQGMGMDSRIGKKFLNPGPGYGGSCFPKDTAAMDFFARQHNVNLSLVAITIRQNKQRKINIANRILGLVANTHAPRIGVLGLAFKNGTDDVRESPAVEIVSELIKHDVSIVAYDPKAMDSARMVLGDTISYAQSMESVFDNADMVVVLTEWTEFAEIDLKQAAQKMRNKVLFDTRHMFNTDSSRDAGIRYVGIGIKNK